VYLSLRLKFLSNTRTKVNHLDIIIMIQDNKLSQCLSWLGRFRAPLRIVISLLIWTYSMKELLNIF